MLVVLQRLCVFVIVRTVVDGVQEMTVGQAFTGVRVTEPNAIVVCEHIGAS